MNELKQYVKERDEALLSLDEKRILLFCKRYDIQVPQSSEAFWAGVHKAILHLNAATWEQKQASYDWLMEHGFTADS